MVDVPRSTEWHLACAFEDPPCTPGSTHRHVVPLFLLLARVIRLAGHPQPAVDVQPRVGNHLKRTAEGFSCRYAC